MRFYTTERLSANRSKTPEGYLLCEGSVLARTGTLEYAPGETPIKPKRGEHVVRIHRFPDAVFNPISLASYSGKSLCDDHPDDDVTPENWNRLARGVVLNPRRGEGEYDDCVVADILVTHPDAIRKIEENDKIELSAGYDTDYIETAEGEGEQRNIIVNHVALVEAGRCGPRCRIIDKQPISRKGKQVPSTIADIIARAFKAKTADELGEITKEAEQVAGEGSGGEAQHIHVHLGGSGTPATPAAVKKESDDMADPAMAAAGGAAGGGAAPGGDLAGRVGKIEQMLGLILTKLGIDGGSGEGQPGEGEDKEARDRRDKAMRDAEEEKRRKEMEDKARDDETIEGALEMESPPGTSDRARKAKDSAYLADSWQTLVSQIEIITPGARFPTFDSAARPAVTYSKICGMRTETLERAYMTQDKARSFLDGINGGRKPDFKTMTCDSARLMISALSNEIGRANNQGAGGAQIEGFGSAIARQGNFTGGGVKGKIASPADLNRMHREMYAKR